MDYAGTDRKKALADATELAKRQRQEKLTNEIAFLIHKRDKSLAAAKAYQARVDSLVAE